MKLFINKDQLFLSFAIILILFFLCASIAHAAQKRSYFAEDACAEIGATCDYPNGTCPEGEFCDGDGCCTPIPEEEISPDAKRLNNAVLRNDDARSGLEFKDYDFTPGHAGEL